MYGRPIGHAIDSWVANSLKRKYKFDNIKELKRKLEQKYLDISPYGPLLLWRIS